MEEQQVGQRECEREIREREGDRETHTHTQRFIRATSLLMGGTEERECLLQALDRASVLCCLLQVHLCLSLSLCAFFESSSVCCCCCLQSIGLLWCSLYLTASLCLPISWYLCLSLCVCLFLLSPLRVSKEQRKDAELSLPSIASLGAL